MDRSPLSPGYGFSLSVRALIASAALWALTAIAWLFHAPSGVVHIVRLSAAAAISLAVVLWYIGIQIDAYHKTHLPKDHQPTSAG